MTRNWTRIHVHTTQRAVDTAEAHAGGDRSRWISSTIERYAAIVDDEMPRLKRLFTGAQVAEIIAATQDRTLDLLNVTGYVIAGTKDPHLAELMRHISLPYRCVLCECCESYHRKRESGQAVSPTIECLFT